MNLTDPNIISVAAMYWSMANTKFMLESGPKTKKRFAEIIGAIIEHQLVLHKERPKDGNKDVAEFLAQNLKDLDNF